MNGFTKRLAAVVVAALAIALAPAALAQAKKQVKISHATAADVANDNHMVAFIIASYINANSDTLDARIYPANQLGEERAVVEGMQLGAGATMHIGGTAIHNNFNKRMGVLDLPFMWRNYEHAHHVLDGKVGETLAAEHEKLGLKVLGWQDSWGYRNVITSKKEVKRPEDLKGLKIRTIQTPTYVAALNAMGASATPMAFGEVYTALQTGVADMGENGINNYLINKHYEPAPVLSLTEHEANNAALFISDKAWSSLTDEQKKWVQAAADEVSQKEPAIAFDLEHQALAKLEKMGVKVVKDVDKSGFQQISKPIQDKLASDLGPNAVKVLGLVRNVQ